MAKVDIGTETYDSFAGLDEATVYLDGDISRASLWSVKTPDSQGRGLVSATRLLLGLPWVGAAPAFDAVPQVVFEVTAMLAADLLAKPALMSNPTGASNVKVAKAGSAQVEFFAPVTKNGPPIPLQLWNLLLDAGLIGAQSDTVVAGLDGPYVSGLCEGDRPYLGRFGWSVTEEDYG